MKLLKFIYDGYGSTNIGDYIQTLAAMQFAENTDCVEWHRDELNKYDREDIKAIMNGWFTHKPDNWPPSAKIQPLFVATHFNSAVYDTILSEDSIKYLKQWEPIGCRDKKTADILNANGVKAYFSSCLTTTLGYKYKANDAERSGIYIVDPVHFIPEQSRRFQKYLFIPHYLYYYRGIRRYLRSLRKNNCYDHTWQAKKLGVIAEATRSYVLLRKVLGKDSLKRATVITQCHDAKEIPTNEERFKRAEELLKMYSTAELVLTSRIHCALPCLGLETPVIFLQNEDDTEESVCRFDGLLDLHNVIKFQKNRVQESFCELPISTPVKNKNSFRAYSEELIAKCRDYISM